MPVPVRGDQAGHVPDRREVLQLEALDAGDLERLPDLPEDLGLLHRVDAEVGLHVEVRVEDVR